MKKLKLIAACAALCLSSQSFAAGTITATVTSVRVDSNGKGLVTFAQAIGGTPPGCVVGAYASALAFDATTAGGKAVLALALTAKATGVTVSAFGLGTCAVYGSYVEDWNYGTAN
jgi:hypothetical protein